jgi:hypothetical protein
MSQAMLFAFRPAWEDYTTSSGTYMFPADWKPTLQSTEPVRMWAECAVRVNSQGFPTDAPLRKVRPIAIQTRSGIYLVRQKVSTVTKGHGYFVQFQAKAFHLLGGTEDLTAANVEVLMSTYHKILEEAFLNGPLRAHEDLGTQAPPGEFHFRRDFEPSKVLQGFAGPYKELSYYNVRWWRSEGREMYTTAQLHKGWAGSPGQDIFVQVSHSLTISTGLSNVYAEPTERQVTLYQDAIGATMKKALDETAKGYLGEPNSTGYSIRLKQATDSQR